MATGDQTLINFPRESTMKEISQSLQTMAFTQSANLENISTWGQLSGLSRNGYAQKIFDYGDQILEKWTDTAANKEYDFPWQITHFDTAELEDGENIQGTFLEAHYTTPFGVQFSNRAFLRCPDGLAAGTYNVTLGAKWGEKDAQKDTTWQFTLTKAVPAGGSVAGFTQMPDVVASNWKATSYAADGITVIETVPITSGSGGTSLGTMQYATRNGNLNSMQEAGYGWNRWKYSAARQWLNSTQPKGKWWAKQDDWDIAPAQLAQKDGFLCGMSAEMLAVLKTVKVTTLANTVNDGGVTDITYDKVFLASMSQMNVNMSKEEGAVHEYWQRRTKSKTPIEPWKQYPFMIRYSAANHTSPQSVFSRSANRGNASYVMNVHAGGGVYGTYGWHSVTYAPLVFI
ncbi:DUF6273 domain-containing protein [Blautia obeum]|uniref:DUF6273 domain-containing protein n=1 Tax=Blautia obeum TaxID=40520 RepID=UPI0035620290